MVWQDKINYIEIPIFLVYGAVQLEAAITANFILYRTCYVIFKFNETDCNLLGTGNTDNTTVLLENKVQPFAAVILMVKLILEYVIPAICCFFLGSWTDKFGRKPVLVFTTLGYGVGFLIMLVVSLFSHLSPWYIMLAYVPICLTGGYPSLSSASVSYVTDVTRENNRGFRLGFLFAIMYIGGILGGLSSSFIFDASGYFAVYLICTLLGVLAWLFVLIFIPESVATRETEKKLTSLINTTIIKNALRTLFKHRPSFSRSLILTTILVQASFYVSYNSEYYVAYLFLRKKFQWSLTNVTIYNSIINVMWIIGNIFGSFVLHKLMRIHEVYIILIGISCGVFGSTLQALGTESWHIYAGGCAKWLGGAVIPLTFSLLSKMVPIEESGAILSSATAFKILCNLAVAPLYTWMYSSTLSTNPGAFNFLTAGICVFGVILTVIVLVLMKNGNKSQIQIQACDGNKS